MINLPHTSPESITTQNKAQTMRIKDEDLTDFLSSSLWLKTQRVGYRKNSAFTLETQCTVHTFVRLQ
jgi:hypothetical protein